ncbi:hypothetical protein D9M69_601020 [compost metagenome]
MLVLAVPGERPLSLSKPRARWLASGRAALRQAARQSVGITSKPTPGQTTMPAFFAAASWAWASANTLISPVMSR